MNILYKLKKIVINPLIIVPFLGSKEKLKWLPDKIYLKLIFRAIMRRSLNLKNPQTFNEKLQYLKLYDRNPLYTSLVDKYEVRKYISKTIGEEYLIPLLGVWNTFDDIDFDKLPEQFVLKCTHDSGGVVICRDKNDLDINSAKKIINKSLKQNYYYLGREWPYKDIQPRIICEEYICDKPGSAMLTDYKFYCFDGRVNSVMLCIDREKGDPKFYFFNKEWQLQRYNIIGKNAPENFTLPKPDCIDQMFRLARKLSKDIPFVRMDMYCSNGQIYFGEFTFYPSSGMDPNRLPESDILFGDMLNIEKIKLRR